MEWGSGAITRAVLMTALHRQQDTGIPFEDVFRRAYERVRKIEKPSVDDIAEAVDQAEIQLGKVV